MHIHRQNTLLYNRALVADADAPKTWDDFFSLAARLIARGIVPLALSATGGWPLEYLFVAVMAGTRGIEFHDTFYRGEMDMSDPQNVASVADALDTYIELLSMTNANAGELDWDEAADLLMNGEATMYLHGDWTKGYYQSMAWIPGVDFNAIAAPGNQGSFIYSIDAFALCANAPNRDNALDFFRVIGGSQAQSSIVIFKAGIPARNDANTTGWDMVTMAAYDDYRNAKIRHNTELHQFNLERTPVVGGYGGVPDRLYDHYQGKMTRDEVLGGLTLNYDVASW